MPSVITRLACSPVASALTGLPVQHLPPPSELPTLRLPQHRSSMWRRLFAILRSHRG